MFTCKLQFKLEINKALQINLYKKLNCRRSLSVSSVNCRV